MIELYHRWEVERWVRAQGSNLTSAENAKLVGKAILNLPEAERKILTALTSDDIKDVRPSKYTPPYRK